MPIVSRTRAIGMMCASIVASSRSIGFLPWIQLAAFSTWASSVTLVTGS
jgi:hypothetical protein